MELRKVSSSNLAAVGYNEEDQSLVIQFKNGMFYEFKEVPIEVYNMMLRAPSIGKYFNAVIRNKFAYTKLNFSGE